MRCPKCLREHDSDNLFCLKCNKLFLGFLAEHRYWRDKPSRANCDILLEKFINEAEKVIFT